MKKLGIIIALLACLCVWALPNAFAGGSESSNSCEGYKGKLLNRCVGHPDQSQDNRAGVGVDVLIHETEHLDLVAEYKYDVNNKQHGIFGVFKTKKSLVEYVKALLNKD